MCLNTKRRHFSADKSHRVTSPIEFLSHLVPDGEESFLDVGITWTPWIISKKAMWRVDAHSRLVGGKP